MPKIEKILVPFDKSPASKAAIQYGMFLAEKLGATMDLLHVASPEKVRGADDVSILHRGVPGSTMEAYAEEEIQGELTEFVKEAGLGRTVRFDEIEEDKDAAHCILKIANEKKYDLIVMGVHGKKGGFERFFTGSVTEKVMQQATCGVLTCHAAV